MNRLQFINLDFGGYMPIGCMMEYNYLTSMYLYTFSSIGVCLALYVGSKIAAAKKSAGKTGGNSRGHAYIAPSGAIKDDDEHGEQKQKDNSGGTDWEALLFNNLLLFTFLILPSISTKIILLRGSIENFDESCQKAKRIEQLSR